MIINESIAQFDLIYLRVGLLTISFRTGMNPFNLLKSQIYSPVKKRELHHL